MKPGEKPPVPMTNDPKELIPLYKYYRNEGTILNSAIVGELPKAIVMNAGNALGIARGKTLVFKTMDEASVLMDYCIYDCPWDGKYAYEWYQEKRRPAPESAEFILLTAMRDVRYDVYRVTEPEKGVGVFLESWFLGEKVFVMDYGFSVSARPGTAFAGRLIAPENLFYMTTGAMLPMLNAKTTMSIAEFVEKNFGSEPGQLALLPREQQKQISTFSIRALLHAGVTKNMAYQTAPGVPENPIRQSSKPNPGPYPGTSRNAPCPCGSGKKYKMCCLPKE